MKIYYFLDNKYTKWYFSIIDGALSEERIQYETGFYEKHHIIPKSLGGENKQKNYALLSLKEHFIVHLLLRKMVEGDAKRKMTWAIHRMINSGKPYSRHYEIYRIQHSQFLRENHHSRRIDGWNEKMKKLVTESWRNDLCRRKRISSMMSERHVKHREENPEKYFAEQKKKSIRAAQMAKLKIAKRLEYKGKIYIGYKELYRATKVSKHLYVKYYLNGIDPEFRIDKNGPIIKKENQCGKNCSYN